MSHLAPHRLAALAREELQGRARAIAQEHVRDCQDCQGALVRIRAGQVAMRDIASQGAPELGWDHIAARVYWSTSSERREHDRLAASSPHSRWALPVLGSVSAAAMAGLALWAWNQRAATGDASEDSDMAMAGQKSGPAAAPVVAKPESRELTGILTFAQGEVSIDGAAMDFDEPVRVGALLQTRLGRAVVQFGEQSAFRVAAQSQLRIARFDRERIELQIDGIVDVDITRRLAGQEFVVVAGGHEVIVRGTAFRVEYREGEIGVSCTRGKVVVTDGEAVVHVPAGQAFRVLSTAWQEAALRSLPIEGPELRALERAMHLPMLPSWTEDDPLAAYGSVIEVEAPSQQLIAVDGVYLAEGSFLLRSTKGRHSLTTVDEEGVAGPPQWLDLADADKQLAKVSAPEAPASTRQGATLRRGQIQERIGKRAAACLKPLAKKGLVAGSYVAFDVGINSDGSHRYLNVTDSNLSPMIQRCFRDAVDAIELPDGPEASFRLKLAY